jgi:hypothetical protein
MVEVFILFYGSRPSERFLPMLTDTVRTTPHPT